MKDENVGHIAEYLDVDTPGARLNVADSLQRIATWHAINGQILLSDGEQSGWAEVNRVEECQRMNILL